MMANLRVLIVAALAAAMGACSSGSDNSLAGGGGTGPGGGSEAEVASLTLLTSSPQMPSDGSADATITALVRDSNNNVMEEVPVVLSASSGSLVPDATTTDENGTLTATLSTAGDQRNRTISVTGTAAGDVQATVDVEVIGTTLTINGSSNLPSGDEGEYNVVLADAGGDGIANQQIEITSDNGNGISSSPVMTDQLGRASFTLSATTGGTDTLTASALGLQTTLAVDVSSDAFRFAAPAADAEINLGANQDVTVQWEQSGAPVSGAVIDFSTTRGTLSSSQATTDGSGEATVSISANNAGPAVITAVNPDGTSVQRGVEFIATTPDTVELQASPFTVPTNDQSAITAIVRDPAGNLVKNQVVSFNLTDTTGGSLSVAQATTDSQGRAQTFYNATNTTSSVDGVRIDATVQGTSVTDFVELTVAQREVFISIGTGNELFEPNTAQYRKEWIVQVTDAQGNGVEDVELTISALSQRYWDGERVYYDPPGAWLTQIGSEAVPAAGCPDEDVNRNGQLDGSEDNNNNGRIEAGNIATAVSQDGGGSTVTTDVNGFALIDVYWPQEYAYWLEITLEARTSVQGTESVEGTTFRLPGLADDFTDENVDPPGLNSPFGTDGDCATPPPPDGP